MGMVRAQRLRTSALRNTRSDNAVRRAEREAELAQRRLREAIDAFPEGIVFLDEELRYILWNAQYAAMYHRSADLFQPGVKLEDTLRVGIARGDYPEANGREEEWLAERMELMRKPGVRHEQWTSDGRCIMIEERRTSGGGTIGLRVDITEMKKREEDFRLLFERNPVPMFLFDIDAQTISAANDAAADHYGYSTEEFASLSAETLFACEDWHDARRAMSGSAGMSDRVWRQRRRDGSPIEVVIFARRLQQDGRDVALISIFDVTERRRAEARIAHMATHDELTGLANRSHFRQSLEASLDAGGDVARLAVLIIDLDHFKSINDTLGHAIGDRLLAEAAQRFLKIMPEQALAARVGGDEFAVILPLPAIGAEAEAARLADWLVGETAQPFLIEGHRLTIGATVGIALAPLDSADAETLVKFADLALYAAKQDGRGGWRRFEANMDTAAQTRRKLEADLRLALERGELVVHYQPLVDLDTNQTTGYEALLRWQHPERGLVPPGDFIPLAEEVGLIGAVGQQVLRTACRDAAEWPDHLTVAVNLSPLQFRSSDVLALTVHALAVSGLDPSRLELEITEAVLMEKSDEVLSTMLSLRRLGVGISMDDFGTGYSSLSYLRNYPFSKIKIDRSFVTDLDSRPDSQAIVKAIIGLGTSLGMKVTAEGIEEVQVLDYLRAEGCTQGQGYYFAAAQAVDALGATTQRKTKKAA